MSTQSATGGNAVDWHESIADSFARGYDRSPRFRERLAVWRDLIARHIVPGSHVLDAGCGAGTFSFELARHGARVTAFDGSPAMIELCERRSAAEGQPDIAFSVALLESVSAHPAQSYDAVISSSVLEYLPDLDAEIARLARVLKPGGHLIVSMPNRQSLYRRIERIAYRLTGRPRYYAHVRSVITADELAATLHRHGLAAIETRYFADPPIGLVARLSGGDPTSKTLFATVARKHLDGEQGR